MPPGLIAGLRKRDVTKKIIYQDYIKRPEGYKHSSFLEGLNAVTGASKPSMPVQKKRRFNIK